MYFTSFRLDMSSVSHTNAKYLQIVGRNTGLRHSTLYKSFSKWKGSWYQIQENFCSYLWMNWNSTESVITFLKIGIKLLFFRSRKLRSIDIQWHIHSFSNRNLIFDENWYLGGTQLCATSRKWVRPQCKIVCSVL